MATDPRKALPRGPHQLSREEVERSQRDRLLWAMTEAVAANGYANTAVADVLSRAGVSRATFYQQFKDKEDCFQAAYQASAEVVAQVMEAELAHVVNDGDARPIERLDRVFGVYLEALGAAPALARVFLVEVYAAGPKAIEQRRASLERFVDVVSETYAGEPGILGNAPEQRFAVEALCGAVSSMVTNILGTGDLDQLSELRAPLLELLRQLTEKE